MAGLLDSLDDPQTQGLLSLGLRLMQAPGNFGQALGASGLGALGDIQQARVAAEQRKRAAQQAQMQDEQLQQMRQLHPLQVQQAQAQIDAQRRAAEAEARQQAWLQSLPMPGAGGGVGAALAGGGGPTVANAAKLQAAPAVDPMQAFMAGGVKAGAVPLQAYLSSMQKDTAPIKLGQGEKLLQPGTFKELANNPKAADLPNAVQEYQFAVSQGYRGSFEQWDTTRKRAGATSVSIANNMDRGFGEAFARDAAGSLAKSRDQARAAANNIQTLDRIGQVLETKKVALGPTATFETFGRQIGETLGVGGKDNAQVLANTRQVIQGAAQLAADGAQLLAGQGQITEGERALIQRASGGDIDRLTAPEIKGLTNALRKVNAAKISAHQRQLQNVGPQFSPFVPFYQVDAPAEPAGLDSLLQKYGGK